jgi:primary-amine oxidase
MRLLAILFAAPFLLYPQTLQHPLDALTTSEYWAVCDTLKAAGQLPPETAVVSVLLRPPAKSAVLAWQPGQPIHREADVVLLRGDKSFAAVVDITASKVLRAEQLKGVQAPFLLKDLTGPSDSIKKDPRVIEALRKRGVTDLTSVRCMTIPLPYRAIPGQETQRIGIAGCSESHGAYHTWGRTIEGLTIHVDTAAKKVLNVVETDIAPVPAPALAYEEVPEVSRPHTTGIDTVQPSGPGYRISNGEVSWQNWLFRFRLDPRVGVVVNLVRYVDHGRPRSILYEGSLSELFVPYMDPANGWNSRAFLDAGEFYASSGHLHPLHPGLDCPSRAAWFDALSAGDNGAPRIRSNMACLFERNPEEPAWRHSEGGEIYGRPTRQLVLRSVATVGNYDYIMDWRFDPDGAIEVAVGATGVIETKPVAAKSAPASEVHSMFDTGQFVAEHTVGVNHDHFFSYRLDLDVDGPDNSFMLHRMEQRRIDNDPMRKSIWVSREVMAKHEKDAILDVKLDEPSMWMFVNPSVKGPLNYPAGYEVMPGATAKSLMTPDDPIQKAGAFSAHQFWVTPYNPEERYASGPFPTSADGSDGLANWTEANRPIANTDIVGWYTLGFHHIPRSEDWPVMPVMWHSFQIRPFHFFQSNPVLDLPKTVLAQP